MLTVLIKDTNGKEASKKFNSNNLNAAKSFASKIFNQLADKSSVQVVNENGATLAVRVYFPEEGKAGKWHDSTPQEYGYNSFADFKVENVCIYDNAGICISKEMKIIPINQPSFTINPNPNNNENMPNVRIIPASRNSKTGNIPQTYTACQSCPVTACENKRGPIATRLDVCFCSSGYGTSKAWEQCNKGRFLTVPANMLSEFIAKVLPVTTFGGSLLRHNVGGDLCKAGTNDIDRNLLIYLVKAYKNYRAFTYTHAAKTPHNLALAKQATEAGFTVNISCSNLHQVEIARKAGCQTVLTVSTMQDEEKIINGHKYLRCPAVPKDSNDTCKTCRRCYLTADTGRNYTIVFPFHGSQKKQAVESGRYLDI